MSSEPRYKVDSKVMYSIFREILERDETYKSEIAEDLDKSIGAIGDTLDSLEHYGAIKETRRKKAQYYGIDPEGLVSLFCEIWNIDEEKVDPGFQDFLHRYVELYDKGDSSIRKMLREDFAEAAVSHHREHEEWPESLKFLDDVPGLEGFLPVQDYFERAVEDVFEG